MMAREKKEMKPLMLKLGVAFTLSCAGLLYSRHRTRRIRASRPPPPIATHSSVDSRGGRVGQKDDVHASTSDNNGSSTPEKYQDTCIEKSTVDNTTIGLSPRSRHGAEKDGFLSPEFSELVKEVDYSAADSPISPKKNVETPRGDLSTPRTFRCVEPDDYEQEIKHLKSMVRILRERERNLEVQLLDYYGLKEQEKTVMELENRLRISSMENKLLSLKIESLQGDNRRLEAQVAEHGKVLTELEAAKGKIKLLKKKLRYEAEQNREHILTLQERVTNLREQEQKASASDVDAQSKLNKLKDLENECEELRSENLRLQLENAELGQRLESTQILATSVLEDSEATGLKETNDHLKEENESLTKQVEKLQADKCSDVEELVYLRWLNACLRFEMRNYQSSSGKTVARDLSKKMSPKSEEKAKQLILEYANNNNDGASEKGRSSNADLDSDRWSSSQASYNPDFDMSDESPADGLSTSQKSKSSKNKFIEKLKKMIKGKESKDSKETKDSTRNAERDDSDSSQYCWSVSAGTDTPSNRFTTPRTDHGRSSRYTTPPRARRSSSIPPLDIPRSRTVVKTENIKELEKSHNIESRSSSREKRYDMSRRASADLAQEIEHFMVPERSELMKYAAALKGTGSGGPKFCRKSASYSSF